MDSKAPLVAFAIGGVTGWIIENLFLPGPRYSKAFGGLPVPFLPIYGVGAATIVATAPYIKDVPFPGRAVVYGAELSAMELIACAVDRALGPPAWGYGKSNSCVDIPHALIWGALGLATEQTASLLETD